MTGARRSLAFQHAMKRLLRFLFLASALPGISLLADGITLTPDNGRIDVKIGGEALDPNKTYRFTVPSYNAAGGDGYPKLTDHPGNVNTGFVDAEVLKDFLEKNTPIDVNKYAPNGEMVYK